MVWFFMNLKTTTINQKILLPALPEKIYNLFLDPKLHSKFTGSKATGKASVGAKFTAWAGYISGIYLELEKGKRIVQEWVTSEWPDSYPPSKLELTFREIEGKTELTMVHSNVPAVQEAELKQGWIDYYWVPLKKYLESMRIF